jgi:RimJ/RimL family protein N-acetyltransferase
MSAPELSDLFTGEKLRLTRASPEQASQAWGRWQRNSEMHRLLDTEPMTMYSLQARKGFSERAASALPTNVVIFHLRTLADDRLIGFMELREINYQHGDAWLGMAIGDRENWNQGYGSDALRLLARYAFDELGLKRITLDVFAYNRRAVRAYEKVGFRIEGVERGAVLREGQRSDIVVMGLLQDDWASRPPGGV